MNKPIHTEGNAIVYCEGAFATLNGKTAHGLVRFCRRYQDYRRGGQDRYAGQPMPESSPGR